MSLGTGILRNCKISEILFIRRLPRGFLNSEKNVKCLTACAPDLPRAVFAEVRPLTDAVSRIRSGSRTEIFVDYSQIKA